MIYCQSVCLPFCHNTKMKAAEPGHGERREGRGTEGNGNLAEGEEREGRGTEGRANAAKQREPHRRDMPEPPNPQPGSRSPQRQARTPEPAARFPFPAETCPNPRTMPWLRCFHFFPHLLFVWVYFHLTIRVFL